MAAVDRTRGLGGLPEAECLVVFEEGANGLVLAREWKVRFLRGTGGRREDW